MHHDIQCAAFACTLTSSIIANATPAAHLWAGFKGIRRKAASISIFNSPGTQQSLRKQTRTRIGGQATLATQAISLCEASHRRTHVIQVIVLHFLLHLKAIGNGRLHNTLAKASTRQKPFTEPFFRRFRPRTPEDQLKWSIGLSFFVPSDLNTLQKGNNEIRNSDALHHNASSPDSLLYTKSRVQPHFLQVQVRCCNAHKQTNTRRQPTAHR